MLVFLLLALGSAAPALAQAGENNITASEEHKLICVYPLSGQYGLLSRVLYYTLFLFCVVAQRQIWLVAGALATAMIYSGTAAVHAVALLATQTTNSSAQVDSDVFGVWAVMSAAFLAFNPVIVFSSGVYGSKYNGVFNAWAGLVFVGTFIAAGALQYSVDHQKTCSDGACLDACLSTSQAMRSPSEMTTIPYDVNQLGQFLSIIITAVFGLFATLVGLCTSRNKVEREKREAPVLKQQVAFYTEEERRSKSHKEREAARTRLEYAQVRLRLIKEFKEENFPCLNSIIACPVVIVINEVYILRSDRAPSNEQPYNIGQWGPWVGVSLALVGAVVNAWYGERWERRQDVKAQKCKELDAQAREKKKNKDVPQAEKTDAEAMRTEAAETHARQPAADGDEISQTTEAPDQQPVRAPPEAHISRLKRLGFLGFDPKTSKWRLLNHKGEDINDLEAGVRSNRVISQQEQMYFHLHPIEQRLAALDT